MSKLKNRKVRDEIDETLRPILLNEAHELLPKFFNILCKWREQSGADNSLAEKLLRCLHTLKGSARMAGAMRLGELIHQVEGCITQALQSHCFEQRLWDELEQYLQRMNHVLEEIAVDGKPLSRLSSNQFASGTQHQVAQLSSNTTSADDLLISFASIFERLNRVVEQTALELGKKVNFKLSGSEISVPQLLLEKLTAPFEHLLRNAIAHGIESSVHRQQLGKEAYGNVYLGLHSDSEHFIFEVSDDGAGIDIERVKEKALHQRLINNTNEINELQAAQLIFKAGITTAREVTEIYGRGIGLDVVSSEVSALGGSLEVDSKSNQGVQFKISLPKPDNML
ncbi:MAG: ATP-binding protein [Gallionellaceae bacterium]